MQPGSVFRTVRIRRGGLGIALTYAVLTAWLGFVLFPLYWLVTMSLKPEIEIFARPPKLIGFQPTLDNYTAVLNLAPIVDTLAVKSDFPAYFRNSIVIIGGAIILTIVFGTFAAYGLARYQFRGRELFAGLVLSTRIIPVLTILTPLYIIFRNLGLYNTYQGLILVYLFVGLPFYILLVRGHVAAVPREVEEAAIVDGCSVLMTLRYIVVPLMSPGIASSALLVLIYMWNNFLFALILGGRDVQPVTAGIMNYLGLSQISYANLSAAAVICMTPVILGGMFIQRYIVSGLSSGSIKG